MFIGYPFRVTIPARLCFARPPWASLQANAGRACQADIHGVFRVALKRDEANVPPLAGDKRKCFFKGLNGCEMVKVHMGCILVSRMKV